MLKEIPKIEQKESFFDLCFKNALLTDNKVALWRLPNEVVKHVVLDISGASQKVQVNFESGKPGFVISPFHNPIAASISFINSDIYFNNATSPEEQDNWVKYMQFLEKNRNQIDGKGALSIPEPIQYIPQNDHEDYLALIEKALKGIREDSFKKVVVARKKLVMSPFDIDPVQLYENLCAKYPSAFVSLIYHPEHGCWVGATPELLASIDQENNFETIALAGTQKMNKDRDLSQLTWSHKEIEEQAYVNRYIAQCFKTLGVKDYEENGPRTIAAGNIAHLRTDFSMKIGKDKLSTVGTKMVELLHPTSAVCGMPRQSSMEFILSEENIERALYSGFLGPVNILGQSQLFVNIRCAKLYKNAALLFAGAGITKESDPEKEWQETELKMNTIQNVLTS